MSDNTRQCSPAGAIAKAFNGQARTEKGAQEDVEGICGKGVWGESPCSYTRGMCFDKSREGPPNRVRKRRLFERPKG